MSTPAVDGAALAARWHQVRARVDADALEQLAPTR